MLSGSGISVVLDAMVGCGVSRTEEVKLGVGVGVNRTVVSVEVEVAVSMVSVTVCVGVNCSEDVRTADVVCDTIEVLATSVVMVGVVNRDKVSDSTSVIVNSSNVSVGEISVVDSMICVTLGSTTSVDVNKREEEESSIVEERLGVTEKAEVIVDDVEEEMTLVSAGVEDGAVGVEVGTTADEGSISNRGHSSSSLYNNGLYPSCLYTGGSDEFTIRRSSELLLFPSTTIRSA